LRRARGKTYEAGAKLDWHRHPGGQVLLITKGAGYYQEREKPARVVETTRYEGTLHQGF
jgi:quercetin dioxygenase-like cupin family protein